MTPDRIKELEEEVRRLREELQKATERERDSEETRRAMLYLIEDANESSAAIERAKREWEATFDSIPDPIFIHDSSMRIVRCNEAYRRFAGLPFKELLGKKYYEAFPSSEGPMEACVKAREGPSLGVEEEVVVPGLNRVFRVRQFRLGSVEENSIHVMEDITEEKMSGERIKSEMALTKNLLLISTATARKTDLERLMEDVVECVRRIMSSDAVLSYVMDGERKRLNPLRASGLASAETPFFATEPILLDSPIVKKAFDEGVPFIVEASADQYDIRRTSFLSFMEDVGAFAALPLAGRAGGLGLLLSVYRKGAKPRAPFSEREIGLMQGVTHQVSIALEEARLYRESMERAMELSRKIEVIQIMHEIDKKILSTLETSEILETAVNMISRLVACERVTIALLDRERGGFVYRAGFGTSALKKGAFVPFGATSAEDVIKTGRAEYVADLKGLEGLRPLEKAFLDEGFLSHIRVPLLVKGAAVGVLTVGSHRPCAYSPEDLSTLEKLSYQIGIALENARLLKDLEDLFLGTVKTLSKSIDAKSPWTLGHSERVTGTALKIAREIGMDEKGLKDLELAGLLHDIGKLGTYEAILDKPGRLTEEELRIMREHPEKGAEILEPIRQLKGIIPAIRHHHEFYDGSGYPDGLKGKDIPLFARILAVADTVDAMGSDRPYRKGKPMDAILAELKRCSGAQFDPDMVKAFINITD